MLAGADTVTGQTYLGLCNGAIGTESLQFWTFAISIFVQACVLVLSFVSLFFPMTDLLHKIVAIEFAVQVVEFVWYLWIMSGGLVVQPAATAGFAGRAPLHRLGVQHAAHALLHPARAGLFPKRVRAQRLRCGEFGWAFDPNRSRLGHARPGRVCRNSPQADPTERARRVAILGVGTLQFIGAFVLLFWLLGNDLYSVEGFWLLIITFVIWLLYGIVAAIAVAPADNDENFTMKLVERAQIRNACYNILDLLSKNAMGIIITAITFARNDAGKGGDEICSPPSAPPPLAR